MTAASATTKQEQTVDAFLGGLVTLVQPRKGHRAGLEAALLQALVPSDAAGLAIDLGAGVGTVAFSVAARVSTLSVVGVELDADLVALGLQASRSRRMRASPDAFGWSPPTCRRTAIWRRVSRLAAGRQTSP